MVTVNARHDGWNSAERPRADSRHSPREEDHDYDSATQLRGSASYATSDNPSAFERANYLKTLHSWTAPDLTAGPTPR